MSTQSNLFKLSVIALLIAILVALALCLSKEQGFFAQFGKEPPDTCALAEGALSKDYRLAAAISVGKGDIKCAAEQWKRVVDNDPTNTEALSNLAMALTHLERYQDALPYYEKAVKLGAGAYDMFAWYARSHKALGNSQEAIAWYYRALSIVPILSDITDELSTLLVATDAPYEALALLSGFNTRKGNPNHFKGNIISIETTLPPTSAKTKLRTASLGGHFYLPVKLTKKGDTHGFMVDTGASFITFDRALLTDDKVAYHTVQDSVNLQTADGGIVTGEQVALAELQVGPYHLENVLAVVCSGCAMLVGQNVLEHFDMKKNTVKGIEFMALENRH